jgi:hypothetical protein
VEHYVGIDVSLELSSVCVVDGRGKIELSSVCVVDGRGKIVKEAKVASVTRRLQHQLCWARWSSKK